MGPEDVQRNDAVRDHLLSINGKPTLKDVGEAMAKATLGPALEIGVLRAELAAKAQELEKALADLEYQTADKDMILDQKKLLEAENDGLKLQVDACKKALYEIAKLGHEPSWEIAADILDGLAKPETFKRVDPFQKPKDYEPGSCVACGGRGYLEFVKDRKTTCALCDGVGKC